MEGWVNPSFFKVFTDEFLTIQRCQVFVGGVRLGVGVLFLSCVCVSVAGVLFSVGVCVCLRRRRALSTGGHSAS